RLINSNHTYPYGVFQISNHDGEIIGKLVLENKNGPLRFEGNADESARVFFDLMIKQFQCGDE
ncbi:MAG: hypothetical protein KKH98_06585, partial [Spirochaetes bacterium]|nr:hypothetical protein [Spirochaetota bacterium]